MELKVRIVSYEKPLNNNFELYDEDSYILEKKYSGETVDDILDKVNNRYNIINHFAKERFSRNNLIYVTYKGYSNGIMVIVEIDDEM